MELIVLYTFFAYGISNILVHSTGPFHIFEKYRDLMEQLPFDLGEGSKCMICTPTQIGILFSVLNMFLFPEIKVTPFYYLFNNTEYWYIIMIMDGCFTSGVVWLLHTLQEYIEVEYD